MWSVSRVGAVVWLVSSLCVNLLDLLEISESLYALCRSYRGYHGVDTLALKRKIYWQ